MIKTPAWWYRKRAAGAPWWRFLLWPLSLLWISVNAVKRVLARPYRSSLFVISVGNLTLGGSGKTPITAEILRLLGETAVGLSRGHGGALTGPLKVDPTQHTAAEVGDEPLMLSYSHDFVMARDRPAGLKLIEACDAHVAVVDDAHQNLKIAKNLDILVVDGDTRGDAWPFGDGGVFPYGPMREPLRSGLKRADLCIVWLPDASAQPDAELLRLLDGKPVFVARLTVEKPEAPGPVVAFAGIAKPWKFEETLTRIGYPLRAFTAFPDHATLSTIDLSRLSAEATAQNARVITTQKDWVRLDAHWRERIDYLPISARFDDEDNFVEYLRLAMARDGLHDVKRIS